MKSIRKCLPVAVVMGALLLASCGPAVKNVGSVVDGAKPGALSMATSAAPVTPTVHPVPAVTTAKPVVKPVVKLAPKVASKPVAKAAPKPVYKAPAPVVKAAPKPVVKVKVKVKPKPKPVVKPAPKPVVKAASLTSLTCKVLSGDRYVLSFTFNRPPEPSVRITNMSWSGTPYMGSFTYNGREYTVDKDFSTECGF